MCSKAKESLSKIVEVIFSVALVTLCVISMCFITVSAAYSVILAAGFLSIVLYEEAFAPLSILAWYIMPMKCGVQQPGGNM